MRCNRAGTHLNVNAYEDEEVAKVTLLEGSVKIGAGEGTAQRRITCVKTRPTGHHIPVIPVIPPHPGSDSGCATSFIAWKDGFFEFNNMPLPAIMRQ